MLSKLKIGIKGAGEIASGIACRLYGAHMRRIVMLEVPSPLAVRRKVSFCEAVYDGSQKVEGVMGRRVQSATEVLQAWKAAEIAVRVDPRWQTIGEMDLDVVIDATLAKRNLGTNMSEAPLVIGLGPGFWAAKDVHLLIETNRGHDLGRIIDDGPAAANTGIPGNIGGYTIERVLRAPADGTFETDNRIGDLVHNNQAVASVAGCKVTARIDGVLRGLIRSGTQVTKGMKVGDIDPRGEVSFCNTISDKARAIGGAVLEAILRKYNTSDR